MEREGASTVTPMTLSSTPGAKSNAHDASGNADVDQAEDNAKSSAMAMLQMAFCTGLEGHGGGHARRPPPPPPPPHPAR